MTKPDETESVPATEPRAAATSADTITPTAAPIPTPTPTPTPIPMPASVYIPRDTLPDGQLFESDYYAVLPGEGAYYTVFDCYGNAIYSFYCPITFDDNGPPIGLVTEKDLSPYCRLNQSEVKTVVPEGEYINENLLCSNENGFYQIDLESGKSTVYLYDTSGKPVQTLKYSTFTNDYIDTVVECMGSETVVTFRYFHWDQETEGASKESIAIYFVATDGTINNLCKCSDLPGDPIGLLARKYFIAGPGDGNHMNGTICDFDGKPVMENVYAMQENGFRIWGEEGSMQIYISDYFTKDGQTYDASLQPVEKNQVAADGKLIYGAEYDVAGITCSATYGRSGQDYFNWRDDIVAVGMQNNQIALKTNDAEYVFACNGSSYCGMNDYVLLLKKDTGEIEVILLRTGEILYTISYNDLAGIADEYVLVRTDYQPNTGVSHGEYLIDKVGNVRYVTQNSYFSSTYGENIVLYRGPYVGIADLNGDWVIKTPTTKMTRDAATPEYWANIT